jgi:hypothetical protein
MSCHGFSRPTRRLWSLISSRDFSGGGNGREGLPVLPSLYMSSRMLNEPVHKRCGSIMRLQGKEIIVRNDIDIFTKTKAEPMMACR